MLRLSTLLVLVSCIVLHAQKPYSSVIDNADGTQTFNLCVSLHRTANAVERAQYEDVIHHMARAIYEASNGGHYVGEIRFFQNGRHQGAADIIWTEAEWPRATPNGLNPRMGKIRIGDWTRDWGSPVDWLQTAENRERLGYTLGHEFGHYVYSMYDQYKLNNPAADPASPIPSDPLFADTPTEPSIMNDQYEAVGGNWEWLNFDTPNNFELNNAHGRVWGVSGWEFLTQAVTDDPLNGTVTAQPPRTRYNALAGRAPTAASTWTNPNSSTDFTWMQVDLDAPGADPLRDLDIIWMNDEIELVFMLDRSGSMSSNNGLSDSKDALKQLVNFLPPGLSTIGLTSFSDQGGDITEVPMTLIPNPVGTVISNLHTAIDNISTANRTALFDGAHYGLSLLDDYRSVNGTNAIRLGMLLSDGNDNQSVNDITSVINAYTSSNVPLHTFGYGNGSHHNILSELSSQTGGDHHAYVTDGDLLHNAFLNAISSAVNMQVLPGQWNPGATLPLTVDPTHTSITLVVTYELGDATGSLDFEIVDALDNLVNPAPTIVRNTPAVINYPYNETATITINGTTLANHGTGIWHIDFISAGNITINPNVSITSTTRSKTPDLMVENLSGPNISYPQPLLLTASVVYDNLLTDLTISAVLKKPDNTSVPIQLFDDGSHGDAVAKDGIYSNVYSSYDQNGTYTLTVVADNHSGTAKLTDHGDAFCKAPDGTAPTYTLTPYSDNFARQKSISFNVQGVVSDDHGNDPTNPSVLPLDNSLVAGKIEYPADMDAFVITVPANQDVIVRVSDMDPAMSAEMKIYGPDGVTLIGYTNTNVGSTENGYLMIPVSSSIHSRNIYVTVNDLDDNVSNAVYKISAGPQKFGDVVAAPGIEVYAKDEGLHENNIVKPRMYIKNTGNESLSNFTVNYYFTSENGKTPVLENYYSPYCNVILSHISSDLYMVSFNYQGFTLEPGATVPDNSGSVIGIRYNDWSSMDKTNDYSNPGSDTFTKNDRIAVFSDGVLVSGSFPLTM